MVYYKIVIVNHVVKLCIKGHEWLSFMTFFILYKSFEVLWQKQNQYSSVRIVGLSHLNGWDVVHNVANGIH